MDIHDLRKFLKQNFSRAEVYDTQWEYRRNMLSRWNVHNEQVLRMMKKAVSFRPIVDIQQFITENICDIPDKPDIEAMQQNIRNYKRHEQLAQQQEEKLTALQEISTLYREMTRSVDRWRVRSAETVWRMRSSAVMRSRCVSLVWRRRPPVCRPRFRTGNPSGRQFLSRKRPC